MASAIAGTDAPLNVSLWINVDPIPPGQSSEPHEVECSGSWSVSKVQQVAATNHLFTNLTEAHQVLGYRLVHCVGDAVVAHSMRVTSRTQVAAITQTPEAEVTLILLLGGSAFLPQPVGAASSPSPAPATTEQPQTAAAAHMAAPLSNEGAVSVPTVPPNAGGAAASFSIAPAVRTLLSCLASDCTTVCSHSGALGNCAFMVGASISAGRPLTEDPAGLQAQHQWRTAVANHVHQHYAYYDELAHIGTDRLVPLQAIVEAAVQSGAPLTEADAYRSLMLQQQGSGRDTWADSAEMLSLCNLLGVAIVVVDAGDLFLRSGIRANVRFREFKPDAASGVMPDEARLRWMRTPQFAVAMFSGGHYEILFAQASSSTPDCVAWPWKQYAEEKDKIRAHLTARANDWLSEHQQALYRRDASALDVVHPVACPAAPAPTASPLLLRTAAAFMTSSEVPVSAGPNGGAFSAALAAATSSGAIVPNHEDVVCLPTPSDDNCGVWAAILGHLLPHLRLNGNQPDTLQAALSDIVGAGRDLNLQDHRRELEHYLDAATDETKTARLTSSKLLSTLQSTLRGRLATKYEGDTRSNALISEFKKGAWVGPSELHHISLLLRCPLYVVQRSAPPLELTYGRPLNANKLFFWYKAADEHLGAKALDLRARNHYAIAVTRALADQLQLVSASYQHVVVAQATLIQFAPAAAAAPATVKSYKSRLNQLSGAAAATGSDEQAPLTDSQQIEENAFKTVMSWRAGKNDRPSMDLSVSSYQAAHAAVKAHGYAEDRSVLEWQQFIEHNTENGRQLFKSHITDAQLRVRVTGYPRGLVRFAKLDTATWNPSSDVYFHLVHNLYEVMKGGCSPPGKHKNPPGINIRIPACPKQKHGPKCGICLRNDAVNKLILPPPRDERGNHHPQLIHLYGHVDRKAGHACELVMDSLEIGPADEFDPVQQQAAAESAHRSAGLDAQAAQAGNLPLRATTLPAMVYDPNLPEDVFFREVRKQFLVCQTCKETEGVECWRACSLENRVRGSRYIAGLTVNTAGLGESRLIEWKLACWPPDSVSSILRDYVLSFLNSGFGGTMLLGVSDDGIVCGVPLQHGRGAWNLDLIMRQLHEKLNRVLVVPLDRSVPVSKWRWLSSLLEVVHPIQLPVMQQREDGSLVRCGRWVVELHVRRTANTEVGYVARRDTGELRSATRVDTSKVVLLTENELQKQLNAKAKRQPRSPVTADEWWIKDGTLLHSLDQWMEQRRSTLEQQALASAQQQKLQVEELARRLPAGHSSPQRLRDALSSAAAHSGAHHGVLLLINSAVEGQREGDVLLPAQLRDLAACGWLAVLDLDPRTREQGGLRRANDSQDDEEDSDIAQDRFQLVSIGDFMHNEPWIPAASAASAMASDNADENEDDVAAAHVVNVLEGSASPKWFCLNGLNGDLRVASTGPLHHLYEWHEAELRRATASLPTMSVVVVAQSRAQLRGNVKSGVSLCTALTDLRRRHANMHVEIVCTPAFVEEITQRDLASLLDSGGLNDDDRELPPFSALHSTLGVHVLPLPQLVDVLQQSLPPPVLAVQVQHDDFVLPCLPTDQRGNTLPMSSRSRMILARSFIVLYRSVHAMELTEPRAAGDEPLAAAESEDETLTARHLQVYYSDCQHIPWYLLQRMFLGVDDGAVRYTEQHILSRKKRGEVKAIGFRAFCGELRGRLATGGPGVHIVHLKHSGGAGATTLARAAAWELHSEFPTFVLRNAEKINLNACWQLLLNSRQHALARPLLVVVDRAYGVALREADLSGLVLPRDGHVTFLLVERSHESPLAALTGTSFFLMSPFSSCPDYSQAFYVAPAQPGQGRVCTECRQDKMMQRKLAERVHNKARTHIQRVFPRAPAAAVSGHRPAGPAESWDDQGWQGYGHDYQRLRPIVWRVMADLQNLPAQKDMLVLCAFVFLYAEQAMPDGLLQTACDRMAAIRKERTLLLKRSFKNQKTAASASASSGDLAAKVNQVAAAGNMNAFAHDSVDFDPDAVDVNTEQAENEEDWITVVCQHESDQHGCLLEWHALADCTRALLRCEKPHTPDGATLPFLYRPRNIGTAQCILRYYSLSQSHPSELSSRWHQADVLPCHDTERCPMAPEQLARLASDYIDCVYSVPVGAPSIAQGHHWLLRNAVDLFLHRSFSSANASRETFASVFMHMADTPAGAGGAQSKWIGSQFTEPAMKAVDRVWRRLCHRVPHPSVFEHCARKWLYLRCNPTAPQLRSLRLALAHINLGLQQAKVPGMAAVYGGAVKTASLHCTRGYVFVAMLKLFIARCEEQIALARVDPIAANLPLADAKTALLVLQDVLHEQRSPVGSAVLRTYHLGLDSMRRSQGGTPSLNSLPTMSPRSYNLYALQGEVNLRSLMINGMRRLVLAHFSDEHQAALCFTMEDVCAALVEALTDTNKQDPLWYRLLNTDLHDTFVHIDTLQSAVQSALQATSRVADSLQWRDTRQRMPGENKLAREFAHLENNLHESNVLAAKREEASIEEHGHTAFHPSKAEQLRRRVDTQMQRSEHLAQDSSGFRLAVRTYVNTELGLFRSKLFLTQEKSKYQAHANAPLVLLAAPVVPDERALRSVDSLARMLMHPHSLSVFDLAWAMSRALVLASHPAVIGNKCMSLWAPDGHAAVSFVSVRKLPQGDQRILHLLPLIDVWCEREPRTNEPLFWRYAMRLPFLFVRVKPAPQWELPAVRDQSKRRVSEWQHAVSNFATYQKQCIRSFNTAQQMRAAAAGADSNRSMASATPALLGARLAAQLSDEIDVGELVSGVSFFQRRYHDLALADGDGSGFAADVWKRPGNDLTLRQVWGWIDASSVSPTSNRCTMRVWMGEGPCPLYEPATAAVDDAGCGVVTPKLDRVQFDRMHTDDVKVSGPSIELLRGLRVMAWLGPTPGGVFAYRVRACSAGLAAASSVAALPAASPDLSSCRQSEAVYAGPHGGQDLPASASSVAAFVSTADVNFADRDHVLAFGLGHVTNVLAPKPPHDALVFVLWQLCHAHREYLGEAGARLRSMMVRLHRRNFESLLGHSDARVSSFTVEQLAIGDVLQFNVPLDVVREHLSKFGYESPPTNIKVAPIELHVSHARLARFAGVVLRGPTCRHAGKLATVMDAHMTDEHYYREEHEVSLSACARSLGRDDTVRFCLHFSHESRLLTKLVCLEDFNITDGDAQQDEQSITDAQSASASAADSVAAPVANT